MLATQPDFGTPLGNDTYNIRIAIKSKHKWKSGGTRVITNLITEEKEIYLLTIYEKSEFDIVDDKTLQNIISSLMKMYDLVGEMWWYDILFDNTSTSPHHI